MSATTHEPLTLLERAAELRARGRSWDEAATTLAVPRDELRQLVAGQNRDYQRLTRRARADLLQETRDRTLDTLRDLMQSDDPHQRLVAATTFVRYDATVRRHNLQEAQRRLDRDTSPLGRERLGRDLDNFHAQTMSRSTEMKNPQDVTVPKNVAQPTAQNAPKSPPAAAKPAVATPPVAPAATAQASPATKRGSITPDELERRKQVLLNDFVFGGSASSLGKGDRLDREIARLVDGMLADAPPG